MEKKKVAKKKPHTEELPSPTSKVITPFEAGQQFVEHLKKQPEKMDKIMDKVMDLDLEKVLEKLGDDKPTVSDDDMKMLGEAIVEHDSILEGLVNNQNLLKTRVENLTARLIEIEGKVAKLEAIVESERESILLEEKVLDEKRDLDD